MLIQKRRVTVDGDPVGWIEDVLRTVPLHEALLGSQEYATLANTA